VFVEAGVEVQVSLAEVEGVAHVRGYVAHGKAKSMGVLELQIAGHPVGGAQGEPSAHAREFIQAVLPEDVVD
jgi:hypothetical protein